MENLTVLGSTGSIGQSTLDVVRRNRDLFCVYALGAGSNAERMISDCIEFNPAYAVLQQESAAEKVRTELKNHPEIRTEVLSGSDALNSIASAGECDSVMAAIVGSAGLVSALAAVKSGKKLYLANKESLIMTGHLFIDAARKSNSQILPVDSEHNAIFQSLPESEQHRIGFCDLEKAGISHVLLTGSGGPFRECPLEQLESVTPAQALAHPTWSMGPKITVDSSTMMNKGFEFIEAKWLFNLANSQIKVLVHPQSVVHSMVQYLDGSVIAELGNPDMRTPIARVMAYPNRITSGVEPMDFVKLSGLTFMEPDYNRYPCLKLAMDSCWSGQAATTALNAANEVAVYAFLNGRIAYLDIYRVCADTVARFDSDSIADVDSVLDLHSRAEAFASQLVSRIHR
ncbi:MAG: 1-deoxy-D-xylulose-5-phosphate reductoisomerase [Succinivibrionaceae bacterium]|nr:1-deoxy-D-xylulose-5-phosphate reductoisomerase [Succinivibrionaceae bacterium]